MTLEEQTSMAMLVPQIETQITIAPSHSSTSTTILRLSNNVTVRTLTLSDVDSITKHVNNRKIWINLRNTLPHPYTTSDAEFYVGLTQDVTGWQASGPVNDYGDAGTGPKIPVMYVICINDLAVGSIGLKFGADVYSRSAEIGYWLGEEFWGRGVMKEVLREFVKWAWETFPVLVRMYAQVYSWNLVSGKVLKSAGFEHFGSSKCSIYKDGKLGGEELFEIIREGVTGDL